ncbi:GNAT family N-acetyltransferase [Histidinibacterium aquaticum]|uniref:GNAT family N-acetyltransferase n=1 Tax=Histidinibacterium aquaticum TaxID=2613962 RepID=A0A5J5GFP7_9RHOB|nr:GNAT family N-acetyltransferase [Histidinibacterium aquaticum]KAA9006907.1 GNAT family N-acetyltransferase [Histidinibacterium aquaticum]
MTLTFGLKSLGLATDLLAMTGLSDIESLEDRIVVRTPGEPDYWFGNTVIFRDDRIDPRPQVEIFNEHFPDARHIVIQWDSPGLTAPPEHPDLEALKLELEYSDVLTLDGVPEDAEPPEGIDLRRIGTDEEWGQVVTLQNEMGLEDGYDPNAHPAYIEQRFAAVRRQIEGGLGAWFGAFDGDRLVGDMGVLHDDKVARFRSVETAASHRRRGICSALLSKTGRWVRERAPEATLVIVADSDGSAGRLYQAAGFRMTERMIAAVRPGY